MIDLGYRTVRLLHPPEFPPLSAEVNDGDERLEVREEHVRCPVIERTTSADVVRLPNGELLAVRR